VGAVTWWQLLPLALAACSLRRVPHYEPVAFVIDPLVDLEDWQIRDAVRRDLERGRLQGLVVDGHTVPPHELDSVDDEVLGVLFSVTRGWARNAEMDLWVPYPEGHRRPMTIRFGPRLFADLTLGPVRQAPTTRHAVADARQRQAVASAGWIGGVVDGDASWTVAELEVARAALASVEAEARPLLDGLTLRRMEQSPRAPAQELAWFDPTTEPPVVDVYDLCFAATDGFVGPVDHPRDPAVMTIVHELGHALADRPLREAWVRLVALREAPRPDPQALAQATLAWRHMGRHGPVIEAWATVRDGPGPGSYGARSLHESFAEAYALHRLDPAALERAMPGAAAWFDQGGHLAAAAGSR